MKTFVVQGRVRNVSRLLEEFRRQDFALVSFSTDDEKTVVHLKDEEDKDPTNIVQALVDPKTVVDRPKPEPMEFPVQEEPKKNEIDAKFDRKLL